MTELDIRKYGLVMAELGLTGLEIKNRDCEVRLERNFSGAPVAVPVRTPIADAAPEMPEQKDTVPVTSPMVGVFYQAPAEDAEPYVKLGDKVQKGAVLCLVEAMKMMNEITAECDGVIDEICVQNGQVVDYGKELFRIRR